MKLIYFLIALTMSSVSMATSVDGEIFYKLPNGDLATRNVTIDVPARGQGEVVISGDKFEWRTKKFWTVKAKGQTLFFAAFKTKFRNFKSTILFKGTYLKGKNQIMYYGDFYKRDGHHLVGSDSKLKLFKHGGGFKFDYTR